MGMYKTAGHLFQRATITPTFKRCKRAVNHIRKLTQQQRKKRKDGTRAPSQTLWQRAARDMYRHMR